MLHPDVPRGAPRHLSRALQRADPRAPALARRHGGRAAAGAAGGERAAPGRPRPGQLLGLQLRSGTSRPTCASPRAGHGRQVEEFKAMVRRFHAAGLEVLLDVVYNHTAEGGHRGPTLSFRGIDNAAYYRLDPAHRDRYLDFTGCGNTLDLRRGPGAGPGARQPALLGRGDARRRVPLRHRARARPTAIRRSTRPRRSSSAWRADPVLSRREADRRAVGPRARTATRSAPFRRGGRSGTASSATACAASGAATPAPWASSRRG